MTDFRVTFKKPAKLGQDAALALEDYARVSAGEDAGVVMDSSHHITGVQFPKPVPDAIVQDIERFFDSLASDAADRLGWS